MRRRCSGVDTRVCSGRGLCDREGNVVNGREDIDYSKSLGT